MWKTVETDTGKVRMGEAKGRREKGRKGKDEDEKGENNGSKKSSRGIGDME